MQHRSFEKKKLLTYLQRNYLCFIDIWWDLLFLSYGNDTWKMSYWTQNFAMCFGTAIHWMYHSQNEQPNLLLSFPFCLSSYWTVYHTIKPFKTSRETRHIAKIHCFWRGSSYHLPLFLVGEKYFRALFPINPIFCQSPFTVLVFQQQPQKSLSCIPCNTVYILPFWFALVNFPSPLLQFSSA